MSAPSHVCPGGMGASGWNAALWIVNPEAEEVVIIMATIIGPKGIKDQ